MASNDSHPNVAAVVVDDDNDNEDYNHSNYHYDEVMWKTLRKRNLLEDSSLSVTNRWQWREALLYNLGSASLPDGPTATSDFDRAWQNAVRRLQAYGFSIDNVLTTLAGVSVE